MLVHVGYEHGHRGAGISSSDGVLRLLSAVRGFHRNGNVRHVGSVSAVLGWVPVPVLS